MERDALRALISDQAGRCVRCGKCRSVCPVFGETVLEPLAARGRLAALRGLLDGRLNDAQAAQRIEACLLCGRCSAVCDVGLEPRRAFRAARELLIEQRTGPARHAAYSALPRPELLARAARLAGLAGRLLGRALPDGSGLVYRLPWPAALSGMLLPQTAERFFIEQFDEPDAERRRIGKAHLFIGCVHNYIKPEVSHAATRLLAALGFDVRVPLDQGCCGLAAHGAGEASIAREAAERNISALLANDPDVIVTTCGSCGAMLKRELPELFAPGDPLRHEAEHLAAKVVDIIELTDCHADQALLSRLRSRSQQEIVTYHDSCHLRLGLGVAAQPRRLLRAVLGPRFVEFTGAELCCGSGGAFGLHFPEISRAILERKLAGLKSCGATVLAAACGGCELQFNQLSRRLPGLSVEHPLHWLDPAR